MMSVITADFEAEQVFIVLLICNPDNINLMLNHIIVIRKMILWTGGFMRAPHRCIQCGTHCQKVSTGYTNNFYCLK